MNQREQVAVSADVGDCDMRKLWRQRTKWLWILVAATCVVLTGTRQARPDKPSSETSVNWNIPMRTMGGKQFWTDHLIDTRWRIQQNILTGHYRLLGAGNSREAWGTWEACLERWKGLRKIDAGEAVKPKIVILLHGLIRSRSSMEGMAKYVREKGDYSTICFSYASTRAGVADHAKALRDVVSHLEGVQEINFVAHSLGNLVIRHYLGDQMAASPSKTIDSRIRRIVMLAPPNNGADLAERLRNNPIFRVVFGVSGKELAERWGELEKRLAVPPCQFGIIAGGGGRATNPLLSGDDDLVVRVDETRLPGARDFVVVPSIHSFIMDRDDVRRFTLTFLQHGYFVSEQKRHPITGNSDGLPKKP